MRNLCDNRWLAGVLPALLVAVGVSGCGTLVSTFSRGFAQDLSLAILDNPDPVMVRDGAPAFLILLDGLVARAPENAELLAQSAQLHSAYAGAFVSDAGRAQLLHEKAKRQALASACEGMPGACALDTMKFDAFEQWVAQRKRADVPHLYILGSSWAGWVQANSDDFAAIAELARVKLLMQKIAEIEPDYETGGVFLYLGVFETLLPPGMGGKPELGRAHFERAIEISQGENLLAKVMYAERYARLVFDRPLHDRLLREVLESTAAAPGMALMNSLAQEQARALLESADDYF